jgi:tetratricopeptide (TPR) repeat protein
MSPGSPSAKPEVLSLALIPEHELLCPIASGAYGQVWLARNRLGVYRAVKIVHRANFDHDRPFEREFAGIKAFEPVSRSHEGLVDLLQVGRDNAAGYFYYVMELADDLNGATLAASSIDSYTPRTLASELKRRGRFSLNECVQIGLALAEALAHLHKQGLVHRDIKPSNIVFVGGVPKLADVGLVSAVADARSFVGTEGFIPPEGPGTPQADIYSLGIVLYVLSTGKSHQDFPEPPADLSSQENHAQWLELDAVILKLCQANVRQRYQTAEQLHEDLALLQRGGSVKQKRAAQRRWGIVKGFGIAAAGLALLIASLLLLKGARHEPESARLYALGQWYYNQLSADDHKKAFTYITQAIQADPKFVQPYSELVMLYVWNFIGVSTDEERLGHLRAISDKVLATDPGLAEGHLALSYASFLKRDWRGAEAEILRAIKLNPTLPIPHYLYCYYLAMQLRTEEARREGQRAELLEPPAAARMAAVIGAWPSIAERRFDLAIAQLRRVLELDRNFSIGYTFLGKCYEAQSNYVAALDTWNTGDLLAGDDRPEKVARVYASLRQAYATSGRQGYCLKWLDVIKNDPDEKKMFSERDLAGYYALLGDKAKALDELEKHFDEPNFWASIKFDPLYDNLHEEPRYKALVRQAGLEP